MVFYCPLRLATHTRLARECNLHDFVGSSMTYSTLVSAGRRRRVKLEEFSMQPRSEDFGERLKADFSLVMKQTCLSFLDLICKTFQGRLICYVQVHIRKVHNRLVASYFDPIFELFSC